MSKPVSAAAIPFVTRVNVTHSNRIYDMAILTIFQKQFNPFNFFPTHLFCFYIFNNNLKQFFFNSRIEKEI